MQPECIVMTVSYIEKVLANPSIVMTVHTWRRITLAALIVADKVFEDYAVWNADFLSLFPQSNIQVRWWWGSKSRSLLLVTGSQRAGARVPQLYELYDGLQGVRLRQVLLCAQGTAVVVVVWCV